MGGVENPLNVHFPITYGHPASRHQDSLSGFDRSCEYNGMQWNAVFGDDGIFGNPFPAAPSFVLLPNRALLCHQNWRQDSLRLVGSMAGGCNPRFRGCRAMGLFFSHQKQSINKLKKQIEG